MQSVSSRIWTRVAVSISYDVYIVIMYVEENMRFLTLANGSRVFGFAQSKFWSDQTKQGCVC